MAPMYAGETEGVRRLRVQAQMIRRKKMPMWPLPRAILP